ncbi:MAG: Uncharacterized MFS-type transporter [uncultured Paraburkholderia sp.]|nr:MAG: Uncharacterized MFS-type transporter [uncultured Paraburkholderia sp.]CAH2915101.1 MAG: Uncharacterized MFS-type transporter [uncultured Paraburkholderia sp.]
MPPGTRRSIPKRNARGIATHWRPRMSTSPISAAQPDSAGQNSSARIIFASFIGTAIEFYDSMSTRPPQRS